MDVTSSNRHAGRSEDIAGSKASISFAIPKAKKLQRRQQQQHNQLVSTYGLPLFPNHLSHQATSTIPLRHLSFLRAMNITSTDRHAVRVEDIVGYKSSMPFANPQRMKLQRRQQLEVMGHCGTPFHVFSGGHAYEICPQRRIKAKIFSW